MTVINATNARKDIYKLIAAVNESSDPVTITVKNGKNAVLIAEKDWENIKETIYLNSIPELVDSINKGRNEKIEDCVEYNEDEEW